jgi:hypothetical protein
MPLHAFRLRFIAGLIAVIAGQRCLVGQPIAVSPASFGELVFGSNGDRDEGTDPNEAEIVSIGGETPGGEYLGAAATYKGNRTSNGGSAGILAANAITEGQGGAVEARLILSWSISVTPLTSGIPANLTAPVVIHGLGSGLLKTGKPDPNNPGQTLLGHAGLGVGVTTSSLIDFDGYAAGGSIRTSFGEGPKVHRFPFVLFRIVQIPQNAEIRFAKALNLFANNEARAHAYFDPQFYIDPAATFELNGQTVRFADAFQLNASTNLFDPLRRPMIDLIDSWRYLDDASNQGVEWRVADFNDAAWMEGQAALGFGEGDEATEIDFGGDMSNKHITTYFRKEFESELSQAQLQSLELELVRDDGIALYLNGIEIYRDNLADEALYDTLAVVEVEDESEFVPQLLTIDMASLPAGTWRVGRNVLAAEVHLAAPSDKDMRFALGLTVILVPEPPGIEIAALALMAVGWQRRRTP